jgi:predicted RNA-binding protein (virulence factor B family)
MKTHLVNSNDVILKALETHGGKLQLSDKSTPEEIYNVLHMSKKIFKKAIGSLYKKRKIMIYKDEISLVK